MLVYVSGPYSAATEQERGANVDRACAAGLALTHKGHWPVVPHLSHFFDLWHAREHGTLVDPEFYMQWDFELLRRCDGLLFLEPSPGANRELALAQERGMPIWTRVEEVPNA